VERAYLLTASIQFRSACCAAGVAMSQDLRAAIKIGCT